jgi:hypothetical protein
MTAHIAFLYEQEVDNETYLSFVTHGVFKNSPEVVTLKVLQGSSSLTFGDLTSAELGIHSREAISFSLCSTNPVPVGDYDGNGTL